jgi:hypothetical protein
MKGSLGQIFCLFLLPFERDMDYGVSSVWRLFCIVHKLLQYLTVMLFGCVPLLKMSSVDSAGLKSCSKTFFKHMYCDVINIG